MSSRPRTARRIALSFVFLYTLASLCLGLGIYVIGDRALKDQLDERIAGEVAVLDSAHQRLGATGLREAIARRDERDVNNMGYLLVDPTGRRLIGDLVTPTLPPLGWATIPFDDPDDETSHARALTVRIRDGSRLTVAMEMVPAEEMRRATILFFALTLGIMLVGGLVSGLLLARAIRRRLDAMNQAALAIIAGDMSQRVPEGIRDDEFRRLAITLNRMLAHNTNLIGNLRQVSSGIAHDMRTPITHLRGRLERAATLATEGSSLHGEISAALDQSDAILSLFAALLRIAEVESGRLRQYFQPIDLSATVRLICGTYELAAEDRGQRFSWDIEDGIAMVGDAELLSQAVINLLDNALAHTPKGTHIHLRLDMPALQMARLVVEDDGPGVPEALLPHLTEPFTRIDKARATPGFGLGLSLIKAIAVAHDGTLRLDNLHPGLGAALILSAREL
jgi:signal transduction histidine kinase